jgi:NADH:ubiquinone oxidoreductase subunit 3 (subunit A)
MVMLLGFTNSNYFHFLFFVLIVFFIFLALFWVSYFMMQRTMDLEKLSAYECGFDPFEESLGRFDIKFYLVAILFLVFDLEIVFLFPWSIMLYKLSMFSFWVIFYFLFILLIGFVYEWRKGALDWN